MMKKQRLFFTVIYECHYLLQEAAIKERKSSAKTTLIDNVIFHTHLNSVILVIYTVAGHFNSHILHFTCTNLCGNYIIAPRNINLCGFCWCGTSNAIIA